MPRREPEAFRITTATRSHSADVGHRQRRYLISMGVRTVCFVLAVVFRHITPLMWAFVVASFVLPYVAVVMANAGGSTDPGGPEPFDPGPDRSLEQGPGSPAETGRNRMQGTTGPDREN
jgi:hypothetical protein